LKNHGALRLRMNRPGIWKIISGGQTGVDLAALTTAQKLGFSTGGWCPPGFNVTQTNIASIFSLIETPTERSPGARGIERSMRTEWNVRD